MLFAAGGAPVAVKRRAVNQSKKVRISLQYPNLDVKEQDGNSNNINHH
jgi:hypothetical protein